MTNETPKYSDFFQRALSAHLPSEQLQKIKESVVLIGGLGGGSNIAELLVRKGFGNLIIADPDVYESHNIRQRGSLVSTLNRNKAEVMKERLLDINPHLNIEAVTQGITTDNVEDLCECSDIIIDMLDLHALQEKLSLHRASRKFGKHIMTAPSVINGAVLWVFPPNGISFEEFSGYEEGIALPDYAWNLLNRAIPSFPSEELKELYRDAAYGKRSIPLDAVGVEQAAVLAVSAAENIVFERWEHVVVVPRGLQVDVSRPEQAIHIADFTTLKEVAKC